MAPWRHGAMAAWGHLRPRPDQIDNRHPMSRWSSSWRIDMCADPSFAAADPADPADPRDPPETAAWWGTHAPTSLGVDPVEGRGCTRLPNLFAKPSSWTSGGCSWSHEERCPVKSWRWSMMIQWSFYSRVLLKRFNWGIPHFNNFQLFSTPVPILQVLDIHSHQGGCPLIGETMALRPRWGARPRRSRRSRRSSAPKFAAKLCQMSQDPQGSGLVRTGQDFLVEDVEVPWISTIPKRRGQTGRPVNQAQCFH